MAAQTVAAASASTSFPGTSGSQTQPALTAGSSGAGSVSPRRHYDLSSGSHATQQLVARLRRCEVKVEELQAGAVSSSAAATDFASQVTERLASLEADVRGLREGAPLAAAGMQEALTEATSGLMDDVRGCARRLLEAAGRDVSRSLETGRQAAVAAAERAATQCAMRAAAEALQKQEIPVSQELAEARAATEKMLAEARELSDSAVAAEARVREQVSHCVGLVDAASRPTNSAGLEALRDLVASVESVSERVGVLERRPVATAPATPGDVTPTSSPVSWQARLEVLERNMPSMHDQLNESLLVVWSAVREISRELCSIVGVSPGLHSAFPRGEIPRLPLLGGTPATSSPSLQAPCPPVRKAAA